MNEASRNAIATRVRGLIGGQDTGDLATTALRLGIDEVALRMTIDDLAPYPTIDVIAAVVKEYGVDPIWLLTGQYDAAVHRKALETDTAEMPAAIGALISRHTPTAPQELRLMRKEEA